MKSLPKHRAHLKYSILCSGLLAAAGWSSQACATEAAAAADTAVDTGLAEIVVTAERYTSTIQNTPISITALTGDQLNAAGITSMEDVIREVPGLSMRTTGPGLTELEARGLASNGGAAPTVGFYLDEIPLSPPAVSQSGKIVIDPDLYDLDRIEVLRGPQGTLYGSGSMGGTVKLVTNQPKLSTYEGSFQGTLSDTEGGSGNGGGSFMLNVPFGETLALRLVGTDNYRSGWLDRVVVSPFPQDLPTAPGFPPPVLRTPNILDAPVTNVVTNVNTVSLYGGRATLLFKPNDDISITPSFFYQRLSAGGLDLFDSPPGGSYQAHYEGFNIREPSADTIHIYSNNAVLNLGFADLTSATAYWERRQYQLQDASESASYANGVYPYVAIPYSETNNSQQFSQELRLSSRGEDRLRWTAGAFFSDLHSLWNEYGANAFFAGPGNPTGIVYQSYNQYHVDQYALFADGSFKITDAWKFSAGLRWYRYQTSQTQDEIGADAPTGIPNPTRTSASNNGYNPRFNLSFTPTDDLTTYASIAKGFRPGGANQILPVPNTPPLFCNSGAPTAFGSDSVWNYELGEKARMFDNWLTINSDFYYIKWTGIQQTLLISCGYEYLDNAGNGRSFGPELEINAKLSDSWFVAATYTYTDAKLTEPNATFLNFLTTIAYNPNGTPYCGSASNCTAPIMNVPRDTASLAVTYTTKVFDKYQLTARVADNYIGTSYDEAFYFGFQLPSYSIANARLTLSGDKWSANLFVDNFTNKIAELTGNTTSFQFNIPALTRYTTNQPRTYGTQINYKF